MDYLLIHNDLILYARAVPSRERLRKRCPQDPRLTNVSLYVEIHHIIPRSLGGLDLPSNLVEVLPEEHLFLHMLRYRIYGKREDALAVRCMLNGYGNKSVFASTRIALTKQIRMGYAWIRSHAQQVREGEGWHTPDGIKRITESRRGKMPARDIVTNELVGNVELTHPNVLSGRWVHHSKGRKQSDAEKAKHRRFGQDNNNASGLTDEYFVQKGVEAFEEEGIILSWDRMIVRASERGFPWIKSLKSRFGGRGARGYYACVVERTGATYDPYWAQRLRRSNQLFSK